MPIRMRLFMTFVLGTLTATSSFSAEKAAAAIQPSQTMIEQLACIGWKALPDGSLVRADRAEQGRIPIAVLNNAAFIWKDGVIVYDKAFFPIDLNLLGPILQGLADFSEVSAMIPKKVGAAIANWGIPPAFDGSPILNPDGSATYFGLMLYQYYVKNPDALPRLSYERLAEALQRFEEAYDEAFKHQSPDVAYRTIELAWSILGAPTGAIEKPLELQPYPDLGSTLGRYRSLLEFDGRSHATVADPALKTDDSRALQVLAQLQTQRYSADKTIVPPPEADATENRSKASPLSTGLPVVLRTLDRILGKALTPAQEKALIESFPMGELIWRLGIQNLWRAGFTGKDMKLAVIDGGAAPLAEFEGAVIRDPKNNFSMDRGAALVSAHGTHVTGIMHQIAPDAIITSYIFGPAEDGNKKLAEEDNDIEIDSAIMKAIADGNRIINISAGSSSPPSDPQSRLIDEFAQKGAIFTIAAGNERGRNGIESPANAPGALTAGSVNVDGRMSDFSAFGVNFDASADRMKYVIKKVLLVPGQNIRSTMPHAAYDKMSGTSMASPVLGGITALLYQAARPFSADPVDISRRITAALIKSADERTSLPPGASLAQHFYIVDPAAALKALQAEQNPVAAK